MLSRRAFSFGSLALLPMLNACSSMNSVAQRPPVASRGRSSRTIQRPNYAEVYTSYPGERFPISAVDYTRIDPRYLRQTVEFPWQEPPGSLVVDPNSYHLYYVESPGIATRYGVGVGREGFGWSGPARVNMKRDWADWVPPREMIEREPGIRAQLEPTPRGLGIRGGPRNPLGARTMYLFGEGRDLGYRIHGTFEPETVGSNVSSGCIRMINQDIAHLYGRVALGTPVTVLPA
jgi:lipoprotein-anchoring transpeptidase ErfK/SrfK